MSSRTRSHSGNSGNRTGNRTDNHTDNRIRSRSPQSQSQSQSRHNIGDSHPHTRTESSRAPASRGRSLNQSRSLPRSHTRDGDRERKTGPSSHGPGQSTGGHDKKDREVIAAQSQESKELQQLKQTQKVLEDAVRREEQDIQTRVISEETKNKIKHHCSDVTKLLSMPELQQMVRDLIRDGLINGTDISLDNVKKWGRLELCQKLDSLLVLRLPESLYETTNASGFEEIVNNANIDGLVQLPGWAQDDVATGYMPVPYRLGASTSNYNLQTWKSIVSAADKAGSDIKDPMTRKVLVDAIDVTGREANANSGMMNVNIGLKQAIDDWIIQHVGMTKDQYVSYRNTVDAKRIERLKILCQPLFDKCHRNYVIWYNEIDMKTSHSNMIVDYFDEMSNKKTMIVPMMLEDKWIDLAIFVLFRLKWNKIDCQWRVGTNSIWYAFDTLIIDNASLVLNSTVRSILWSGGDSMSSLQVRTRSQHYHHDHHHHHHHHHQSTEMIERPRLEVIVESGTLGTFDIKVDTRPYTTFKEDGKKLNNVFKQAETVTALFSRSVELKNYLKNKEKDNISVWTTGGEYADVSVWKQSVGNYTLFGSNTIDIMFLGSITVDVIEDLLVPVEKKYYSLNLKMEESFYIQLTTPIIHQIENQTRRMTSLTNLPKLTVRYYNSGRTSPVVMSVYFSLRTKLYDLITRNIRESINESGFDEDNSKIDDWFLRFGSNSIWKSSADFFLVYFEKTPFDLIPKQNEIFELEIAKNVDVVKAITARYPPYMSLKVIMGSMDCGTLDVRTLITDSDNETEGKSKYRQRTETFREFFVRHQLSDLLETYKRPEVLVWMSGIGECDWNKVTLDHNIDSLLSFTNPKNTNLFIFNTRYTDKLQLFLEKQSKTSMKTVDLVLYREPGSTKTNNHALIPSRCSEPIVVQLYTILNATMLQVLQAFGTLEGRPDYYTNNVSKIANKHTKGGWNTITSSEDANRIRLSSVFKRHVGKIVNRSTRKSLKRDTIIIHAQMR
jgi:hypothetical protein